MGRAKRVKRAPARSGESSCHPTRDSLSNRLTPSPEAAEGRPGALVRAVSPRSWVRSSRSVDFAREGLPRFFPSPDPTHVGASGTGCSVRLIHEVVSKFDLKKRDLVKSTGFEGILHFPCIKQINRKFGLWLMSCVDESSQTLVIGDNIGIKFSKEDVGKVIGIPCAGKRILDNRLSTRCVKWYKFPKCYRLLHVFAGILLSVDLGDLSMVHSSFPRIREFSYDKLRVMIRADKNYSKYLNANDDAPHVKLRDAAECCYYWAAHSSPGSDVSRSDCLLAIWESSVAMAPLLDIPMEAAGPLFVAAADFQDQINSGLSVSGIHAIKFMTVLVSIMLAYKDGFSYQFTLDEEHMRAVGSSPDVIASAVSSGIRLISVPISKKRKHLDSPVSSAEVNNPRANPDSHAEPSNSHDASSSKQVHRSLHHRIIGDNVQRSFKAAMSSLDDMPHQLNVNLRVGTVMSQFYSLVRRLKLPADIDLNAIAFDDSNASHGTKQFGTSTFSSPPSPWALGYSWKTNDVNASDVFAKLHRVRDDEGFIIVYRNPKHIQVSVRSFRSQILGMSEMELDLFDAIIRLVKQDDDALYQSVSNMRWRRFFESDFMESIMSGSFDLSATKLRHHFSLCNMSYDLSNCKLLAMRTVSRTMFQGWHNEWTSAELQIMTWLDKSVPCSNRTGALCALFCHCFDGADLTPSLKSVDRQMVEANLSQQA
ncbi:unnamed protein product [Miscanthus lutarioriparius]|uniref:Uncharacterized protein n=1 Tax=Miscanthus lutarioriparius TaxID=422564 RepID=A0A811P1A7_9POAL|nr:unnamed protein product [Miscanthus lutarioriparius]